MSSYAEDWGQILHFVKSFVEIKSNASSFVASSDTFTYRDVFNGGSGKLVEIIVSWLVDDGCKVENLDKDNVKNLIKVASLHFPCRYFSFSLLKKIYRAIRYQHRQFKHFPTNTDQLSNIENSQR